MTKASNLKDEREGYAIRFREKLYTVFPDDSISRMTTALLVVQDLAATEPPEKRYMIKALFIAMIEGLDKLWKAQDDALPSLLEQILKEEEEEEKNND